MALCADPNELPGAKMYAAQSVHGIWLRSPDLEAEGVTQKELTLTGTRPAPAGCVAYSLTDS